ncbi:hypothetical protein CCY99_06435 [Helicobacter sp. 16-1353]|uniref:hypothetical protein n=1 Tax=Helicobacter sp. 16-1353 TaxID=2004996 RepID=UPI000DCF331B|nr:hypothetical protein [Helicobacter sp. 16-1353]RAX53002.1 hypothetical protein CCY99_06435 [Helicobacter sp. 16-1353]
MKKLLLVFGLLVGGLSVANTDEESGVFVGFEIGGGESQLTAKGTDLAGVVWDDKLTQNSTSYGGKIGYKYFVN